MTELATPPVEESTGTTRISHWIGGRSVAGTSGRSGPVYNPATGRRSGTVDFATVEEVDQAVQAAKSAFVEWRTVSLAKRAELFFRIRELLHERREEMAKLLTAEHGKVLSDAMAAARGDLLAAHLRARGRRRAQGRSAEDDREGVDAPRRDRRSPSTRMRRSGISSCCGRTC